METNYIRIPVYRGYKAKVWWSDEDGVYVGEVIGIKDIVCFHAEEKDTIAEMFMRSVDNYIDFCKEMGKQEGVHSY